MRKIIIIMLLSFFINGFGFVMTREIHSANKITPGIKFSVGEVANKTSYDNSASPEKADIKQLMKDALQAELDERKILAAENETDSIVINVDILKYEPGNAFKRWFIPGYGSTVISTNSTLVSANNRNEIASVAYEYRVDGGLPFSVQAWRTGFKDVAKGIVSKTMLVLETCPSNQHIKN